MTVSKNSISIFIYALIFSLAFTSILSAGSNSDRRRTPEESHPLGQTKTIPTSVTGFDNPLQNPFTAGHGKELSIRATWIGTPRWMGGFNWGGETFFSSLGKGHDFFITDQAEVEENQYIPVQIKFNSDTTQLSLCQTYRITASGTSGFEAAGAGTFPGSAWDMSDPGNPRQINLCYTEWDDGAGPIPDPDFKWNPTGTFSPFYGNREYLFVMYSDYDSGAVYAGTNIDEDSLDVVYAWWPRVENGHTFFETDTASLAIELDFFEAFQVVPDSSRIHLAWVFGDSLPQNVEQVKIYYGTSSPPTLALDSVPTSVSYYLHSGLANGATYYYKFQAQDSAGSVLAESEILTGTPQDRGNGLQLLGFWNGKNNYGGCWGYTDSLTGREYALLPSRSSGLSIVDITDMPPVQVAFIPNCIGCSDSKEVKVYRHYLILVHEYGNDPIYDISDPANPVLVSEITPCNAGSHNCYVDGHYLYIVGNHCWGGLEVFDIENPAAPVWMSEYQPFYYHDVRVRNDTMYACGIYGEGTDILYLGDKSNPQFIGHWDYAGQGPHNVELSEDGNYAFIGDEIGSSGNWTRVFNVNDPNNVQFVTNIIVNSNTIAHNCYRKQNILFIAHYSEGVRMWDISNPASPVQVGYWDTHLGGPVNEYVGAWNVYPYFPSGKVIVSDMQYGLHVFSVDSSLFSSCSAIPGDANSDFNLTLADIVSDVNYVFGKGSWPACGSNSTLCWLSDQLCRGDWDSNGSATLGDVIRGVNYIFDKPGGPWTPLESGVCCQAIP
ncbi:MAG: choice-of-anchor B family protein [candidate division Zixibacteria bacterium]|nr:choice-of-anchor B family protein [candidate division Zixibacteria bacterium]